MQQLEGMDRQPAGQALVHEGAQSGVGKEKQHVGKTQEGEVFSIGFMSHRILYLTVDQEDPCRFYQQVECKEPGKIFKKGPGSHPFN